LLWIELPDGAVDALELQRRGLRSRISIAPGPLFSASGAFGRHLRLSAGEPWSDRLEHAVTTLGRLARR
jgi:DNA-binding transcriptional MocR family regulator